MAERKWTEAQLDAIYERDSTILVSAAAGSGKTSVLTQRIISRITDSENPLDISRILVVTFTKAAAAELKSRISSALTSAIAENPSNKRLQRQYMMLGGADISTIHSFCFNLIKKNFSSVGLPASLRIADDAQTKMQINHIMDDIVEEYYSLEPEQSDIHDFAKFADNFLTIKDERLVDILVGIYNKLRSLPDGVEFLKKAEDVMRIAESSEFFDTPCGVIIKQETKRMFKFYNGVFSLALSHINENPELMPYMQSFEYDADFAEKAVCMLDRSSYREFCEFISSYSPVKLKSVKTEYQSEEILLFKSRRTEFSKTRKDFIDKYYSYTENQIKEMAEESSEFIHKLYLVLSAFEKRYSAEKKAKGLLDYSDLEHYAYRLLINSDGTLTQTAYDTGKEYDEIYIDEYQDVNAIQDSIFRAIGESTERFMVGDIKQSIYAFRGAEPSLFSGYRSSEDVKTIFLQHTFRSDMPVISFVNDVCGYLFRMSQDEFVYESTDDLVMGKTEGALLEKTEIALITPENEDDIPRECEAEYVAGRIGEMLSEGVRPKDIAILMRSAARSSAIFEDALSRHGIPYYNQVSRSLFENPEILFVMCLLNCIDNPRRDIYLAGALKSPVFGVTADELIKIRLHSEKGSLYDALRSYTEDTGFEKGRHFLSNLEEYRKLSSEPIDKIIWALYTDTSVMSMLKSDSGDIENGILETKHANLMLLYDYARKFENDSYKGLYSFICYINDMLESESTFGNANTLGESSDAVRIMTIHQSKGLEFPVCFLCDCQGEFNTSDLKEKIIIDPENGAALKLPDSTGFASCDTIFRQALAIKLKRRLVAEEKRVLYVALTRAVHKLIITASFKEGGPEKLIDYCKGNAMLSSLNDPYAINGCDSYIKWILTAFNDTDSENAVLNTIKISLGKDQKISSEYDRDICSGESSAVNGADCDTDITSQTDKVSSDILNFDENLISEYESILRKRFSFSYSGSRLASLPSKLAVSDLSPSVLDEKDETEYLFSKEIKEYKKPRFIELSEEEADAAEKGTATHIFMQFCDFENLGKNGFEAECERLIQRRYIPEKYRDMIRKDYIDGFLKSGLYGEITAAKQLRREVRFNIRLPAAEFTSDERSKLELENENVLVQGIIDCIIIGGDNSVTVVDYKTDSFPYGMIKSGEAEKALKERHSAQLSYYRLACEQILCRKVDRLLIYSFALGKTIDIGQ